MISWMCDVNVQDQKVSSQDLLERMQSDDLAKVPHTTDSAGTAM